MAHLQCNSLGQLSLICLRRHLYLVTLTQLLSHLVFELSIILDLEMIVVIKFSILCICCCIRVIFVLLYSLQDLVHFLSIVDFYSKAQNGQIS